MRFWVAGARLGRIESRSNRKTRPGCTDRHNRCEFSRVRRCYLPGVAIVPTIEAVKYRLELVSVALLAAACSSESSSETSDLPGFEVPGPGQVEPAAGAEMNVTVPSGAVTELSPAPEPPVEMAAPVEEAPAAEGMPSAVEPSPAPEPPVEMTPPGEPPVEVIPPALEPPAEVTPPAPEPPVEMDRCDIPALAENPPYDEMIRIPLRIHTTRSDLSRDRLCTILAEMNDIWWEQAGICFEMQVLDSDDLTDDGLDMWFERSTPFPNGVRANGVYSGPHAIFTLDRPGLGSAPNPVENLSSRTAAHELGHALNLRHQNCGDECNDLLMTSGRRGFALATDAPASVNEQTRARTAAEQRRLRLPGGDQPCLAPRFDNAL